MREIIIRNIDNAPNGKEFFAGISGNFKDFGQTLCELIDNPISNFHAHGIRGRVEIVLEEQGIMWMSRSGTTAPASRTWTPPSPLPPAPALNLL